MYHKSQVAARFGRAAEHYKCHSQVQDQVAALLLDCLPTEVKQRQSLRLLDLGCGPGSQQALLFKSLTPPTFSYFGLDLAPAMVHTAQQMLAQHTNQTGLNDGLSGQVIQADGEALPFADNTVDLIYSNMAMQWFNRPDSALAECARVLTPNGYFLCSVVLPNSLLPLDQLLPSFVNPQRTFEDWCALIESSPLRLIAAEARQVSGHFRDCRAVLKSISGVGADAAPQSKDKTAEEKRLRLTKRMWAQLNAAYEGYRTPKGLPLHYHIGFFVIGSQ